MSPVADDGSRYARFKGWLGHYAVLVGAAIIALDATNRYWLVHSDGGAPLVILSLMVTACLVVLFFIWIRSTETHEHVMCVRCANDIPDGDVESYRARLSWFHFLHERGWPILVFIAAPAIVLSLFTPPAINAFALVPWVGFAYLIRTHHRFRPWCPFCKDWGDGGSPEKVPDPDPTGQKTA